MLMRKLKVGDRLVIGDATIIVRKDSGNTLRLALDVPEGISVVHERDGQNIGEAVSKGPA